MNPFVNALFPSKWTHTSGRRHESVDGCCRRPCRVPLVDYFAYFSAAYPQDSSSIAKLGREWDGTLLTAVVSSFDLVCWILVPHAHAIGINCHGNSFSVGRRLSDDINDGL